MFSIGLSLQADLVRNFPTASSRCLSALKAQILKLKYLPNPHNDENKAVFEHLGRGGYRGCAVSHVQNEVDKDDNLVGECEILSVHPQAFRSATVETDPRA